MNIFIAGGTGAIGRVLVPLLVNAGHEVVALTRSADRTSQLEQMGAVPVVGDVYDEVRLARLIAESEAEVVVHQLTAFGAMDGDPYAATIRVRTEGTRNLISAARAARVRRFIAQSISFMCSPFGNGLNRRRNSAVSRCSSDGSRSDGSHRVARTSNTGGKRNVGYRPPVRVVLRPGYQLRPGRLHSAPFAPARCRSWASVPGLIRSSIA